MFRCKKDVSTFVLCFLLLFSLAQNDSSYATQSGEKNKDPKKEWWQFERIEPSLKLGIEALSEGKMVEAEDAFLRIETKTAEERAVKNYNIASSLLMQSQELASQAQAKTAAPAEEDTNSESQALLKRAEESYQRAYSLSDNKKLRSDALLGKGNTLVAKQDLKNAVKAYRKSLTENPQNAAARNNLLSSLKILQKQKQEQKDQDGDQDKKDGEQDKKDGDQDKKEGDQDKKDGEQDKKEGDQDKKEGDQDKKEGDQDKKEGDQDKKEGDQDKKEGDQDKKEGDQDKKDGDQDKKDGEQDKKDAPAAGEDKKTPEELQKMRAEELLDALRDEEKSLRPFALEKNKGDKKAPEKNW